MSLDLEEIEPTTRTDFRRANGAPQVVVDGKGERYSRPLSFADPLDDKSALTNWRIDRAALGVAGDRALQARWVAIDLDDKGQSKEKTKLRDDSIAAGRGSEAADIGTALHAMSVRFELEPKFSPPEPYLSSLLAYEMQMMTMGLQSVAFEFQVVNVGYRCAGTADRLYLLTMDLTAPDGTILEVGSHVVGDMKTGAKFEYSKPGYAVQLAIYASGQFYNVVTDEFMDTPDINQDWALVVHMPADEPGVCEFHWVDLKVGHIGAQIVQAVKVWRKNWRSGEYDFALASEPTAEMVELIEDVVADLAPVEPEVAALGAQIETELLYREPPIHEAPPFSELHDPEIAEEATALAELVDWAKHRLTFIAQNDGATKLLMRLWPAGLPTPKQGIETVDQANEILSLLSRVEREYEMSFTEMPKSMLDVGARKV